ncbi:hypothetical protein A176_002169 [Myxococcus hansupus]|uniref:LpxI N-terminal domain-containing protein n=1 Tax=Pseudomyxococcus hansupus TaxID=1297742 RepID=A0A0H4XBG3_9BACT|nr:hypothetical protein A176_002169 [Myxococcus hansupus]
MERIGLIAGNGRLPFLFARAARKKGLEVVAVAHRGETDPALASEVDRLTWVRVGQVDRIQKAFREAGVKQAAMAGGIGRVRALAEARPDLGAVRIISKLRSFRDDALLRAVAADFESRGVTIIAPTDFLGEVLCPEGHLAGPGCTQRRRRTLPWAARWRCCWGRRTSGRRWWCTTATCSRWRRWRARTRPSAAVAGSAATWAPSS